MAEKKQTSQGKTNTLLWMLIVLVIIGSWVSNELWLNLTSWSKYGYLLAVALACCFIFMLTDQSKALWDFAKESRVELRKVVWPDKQEAVRITGIIIAVVIIVSIILSIIDRLLFSLIAILTQ